MFGRKKETKPPSKRAGQSLAQYGLFDVPASLDELEGSGSDGGDSDLEAELAAIAGGGRARARPPPRARPPQVPAADLDSLVAQSLRNIPSDDEDSGGEDDPALLSELSELAGGEGEEAPPAPPAASASPPSSLTVLLQGRITMYTQAEQQAKAQGETSRARRFGRGLKTLKEQLSAVQAGRTVPEDEIPPAVSAGPPPPAAPASASAPASPPPVPAAPAAASALSEESQAALKAIEARQQEYKVAALEAKRSGDSALAMQHLRVVKEFDRVLEAVRAGQVVELAHMPPAPGRAREDDQLQAASEGTSPDAEVPAPAPAAAAAPAPAPALAPASAPITASTAEEALQQRLALYKQQESSAAESGNSSKARRMGRIVKQYEEALRAQAAGKAVPYEELPTPPGYPPIPGAPVPADPAPPAPPPQEPSTSEDKAEPRPGSVRKMGNQLGTGLAGKQLQELMRRQQEFKAAALAAKKKGEVAEAMEYLRCAKGMEPLLEAARGGLPVELASLPLPPQARQRLQDGFDLVSAADCVEEGEGGLGARLEEQLVRQLQLCRQERDHSRALGDVPATNRFEHLALTVTQDLDLVRAANKRGEDAFKFHYEQKQFSVVQCCTDLGDNDLELNIVRGISYTVANPKEIDTYVKFEFPYPQEEPVRDKTSVVKDTNSPEYNATFLLGINRSARPCLRVFKRHALKLEVYSRGGFFSRDSLLGSVLIKLQPLETQTILHDSYDLMDGRKAVGGKLEVKLRARHPLLTKQVQLKTHRWLVMD